MERLYALGVTCIEYIQVWFQDAESYLVFVNKISNPNYLLEYVLPLVSIVDSVFGAQLCLCIAFGSWLNAVAKWWLLEDRPYWWVRETDFYARIRRPTLRQFPQTCETGPGSPSGHSEMTAIFLMLMLCWTAHVMNDRKRYVWWWKYLVFPIFGAFMVSVMVARVYVAAHFPHQTFVGAMLGAFLAPALCVYFADPYIWQYGHFAALPAHVAVTRHAFSAAMTVVIAFATYGLLLYCGWDPMWTVKLAFRWCETPEHIHVSTTPMYALAHSTGFLMGWALCVTPVVAQYRHYTQERSLTLAAIAAAFFIYGSQIVKDNIGKDHAIAYYSMQFLLSAMKPALFLRIVPAIATWPYKKALSPQPPSKPSVLVNLISRKKSN